VGMWDVGGWIDDAINLLSFYNSIIIIAYSVDFRVLPTDKMIYPPFDLFTEKISIT